MIELSKNKDIVISKANKGNAIVIQNRNDYLAKVGEILSTQGKFNELPTDPTIEREKRLQNHLRYLGDKRFIDENIIRRIQPCGSRAGVMYGLPKVHKKGTPIRPIISAMNTYNYNLAKWLEEILKQIVNQEYMLIDTFDFVNKVSQLNVKDHQKMVSFDVESLFTNIPTLPTIELILNITHGPEKVKSKREGMVLNDKLFHQLTRKDLKHLLMVCTQESHYMFNKKYYDQVDGVAM